MDNNLGGFELAESELSKDRKIRDIVVYLTYKCGEGGRLNKTRLMKMIYLAELRAIEKWGRRLTNVDFINWNFGPFSKKIQRVIDEVSPEVRKEKKETTSGTTAEFLIPTKSKTQISLTMPEIELLDEILNVWMYEKNEIIIENSKNSPPYIWTNRGDEIPFEEYISFAEKMNTVRVDDFRRSGVTLSSKKDIEEYINRL